GSMAVRSAMRSRPVRPYPRLSFVCSPGGCARREATLPRLSRRTPRGRARTPRPTHYKGDDPMKRTSALLLFLAIAAPLAAQPPGPSPKATIRDGKTLYQRLGGY